MRFSPCVTRVHFTPHLCGTPRNCVACLAPASNGSRSASDTARTSDAKGGGSANRSVALARAHAVAYQLLLAGIRGNRVRVEGLSAEAPLASNSTAEGGAKNRRVDIRFAAR